MASIRKRISQIWRRSSEKETPRGDEQSSAARRDSIASLDSGYSSIDLAQPATPRNLHKAASTTFQSFSDTIRSKTRIFYVSPEKSDTTNYTEATPKSRQQSGRSSPTPMPRAAKPQWITPTIDVKIPDSFLMDSESSEDNAQKSSVETVYQAPMLATLKPYGPWQLWPTPIDVALQKFSKIDITSARIPRSPMIDDPNVNSSEDFMYDSAMFDSDSRKVPYVPEDQNPNIDGSCANDKFHVKAIVTELKSPALGSNSALRPPSDTDAATKGQKPGDSLFSKGDQADSQGAHVTWLLPEKFQRESDDTGMVSEGLYSFSQLNQFETPSSYSDTVQGPTSHRTISYKAGSRDLFAASNGCLNHDEHERGTRRSSSSSVYESDEEPEASSAEVSAMGSRREWDKVRADRYNRYSAIQFLDENDIMEEDSEYSLELDKLSARRPLEKGLRGITESDTIDIDQGFDLSFAIDEVSDSPEKSPESSRISEELRSDLVKGNLDQKIDASEWWSSLEWSPSLEQWQPPSEWGSNPNPLRAAHPVDAEAALQRLADSRHDWNSDSSYDSDELYIQYERPGHVTTFTALLAPFKDNQDRKNAGTEEPDYTSASSSLQSEILDDSGIDISEEIDPCGYFNLGSGVVWSRLSRMDAPGSTKVLEGKTWDMNDEGTEDIGGILSENECSPLDESPVYHNPSPFPDLKKYCDDDYTPSSMITENTLTDQTDRVASLAKHEANPSPISSKFPDNTCEGFWADLDLDLKDYSVELRDPAQSEGEHDTKKSLAIYNIMEDLDEMRDTKYEFDDPDRNFNAARLPKFNLIPSSALKNSVETQGRVCIVAPPGSPGVEMENKTNSPGTNGHRRWAQKKSPVNIAGLSPSQPQNRRDQTSPTMSEKSNEFRRKGKANRSNLTLSIPQKQALKMLPYRPRESGDVENCPSYTGIIEGQY